MKPRTPYEKIRLAALRGTGCRLSALEADTLYWDDDAIKARADADARGGVDRDDPGPDLTPSEDPTDES